MADRMRGRLGRCMAGISTAALGVTVAAMATAQSTGNFKAAPKAPDGDNAAAAGEGLDMILGVPVNTLFFLAAAVVGVFWFTFGGGRKPKVSRHG